MTVTVDTEPRFSVFSSVGVSRDGEEIDLGSPRHRAVLAMLLLEPGRPVSMDRILDGVWGEQASSSSRASVHTYMSNLRTLLGTP